MGKRIVLVSRRKQVIEFFNLEARLWGHSVSVSPVLPYGDKCIDILICDDIDPVGAFEGTEIYKLVDHSNGDHNTLGFPVSLEKLRRIFGEVGKNQDSDTDAETIYMRQNSREIIYKSRFYTLTESEYRLLEKLGEGYTHPIVTREELMELFGADEGNIVDVYVSRLRKKLEDPSGPRIIETVRGKGYKLRVIMKKYT